MGRGKHVRTRFVLKKEEGRSEYHKWTSELHASSRRQLRSERERERVGQDNRTYPFKQFVLFVFDLFSLLDQVHLGLLARYHSLECVQVGVWEDCFDFVPVRVRDGVHGVLHTQRSFAFTSAITLDKLRTQQQVLTRTHRARGSRIRQNKHQGEGEANVSRPTSPRQTSRVTSRQFHTPLALSLSLSLFPFSFLLSPVHLHLHLPLPLRRARVTRSSPQHLQH